MISFLIGIVILIVGGFFYGLFCEKIFSPDNRKTPAIALEDGVDFIPMPKWKNCLIQLLNIAGTGPILGPIQGIFFGPIAFITIPIGCVLGGALQDYFCGMISMRNNGQQMPSLIKTYLGNKIQIIFSIFTCLLLLLVGAVFIYTPGDIFLSNCDISTKVNSPYLWITYGVIFIYYLIATIFPIDKIIGRIYPIFGILLILSSIALFIEIFVKNFQLTNIWDVGFLPTKQNFIPIFFVTVACGILSGFHSTQSTLISRTVKNEKEGRHTFYMMMILEGFIAMCWAGATMGVINNNQITGIQEKPATEIVTIVAQTFLGNIGSYIIVLGVIIFAITSGDTAIRSMRLMLAEIFKIDQKKIFNRIAISGIIFTAVFCLLIWSKTNSQGFKILWNYFSWANQVLGVFSLSMITVYLKTNKKPYIISLIPATFYMYITMSFILNAKIGFNIPWNFSYIISGFITLLYMLFLVFFAGRSHTKQL